MYKAILFALNGDWVTDYYGCATIQEVELKLADQGSRWFFYPFHAVITDRSYERLIINRRRLVSVAPPFEHMKGRTIATFTRMLEDMDESELEGILT